MDSNDEWDGMAVWNFASRGEPVDELDSACKEAFKRYKCLEQDFASGQLTDEATCQPGMLFEYHLDAAGNIVCGPEGNPEYASGDNACKLAACEIERAFSMRAFAVVGNTMNNSGKKLAFQDGNRRTTRSSAWLGRVLPGTPAAALTRTASLTRPICRAAARTATSGPLAPARQRLKNLVVEVEVELMIEREGKN